MLEEVGHLPPHAGELVPKPYRTPLSSIWDLILCASSSAFIIYFNELVNLSKPFSLFYELL